MFLRLCILAAALLSLSTSALASSPGVSAFLSGEDREHLASVVLAAQGADGTFEGKVPRAFSAIYTLRAIGKDLASAGLKKEALCAQAKAAVAKPDASLLAVSSAVGVQAALGCPSADAAALTARASEAVAGAKSVTAAYDAVVLASALDDAKLLTSAFDKAGLNQLIVNVVSLLDTSLGTYVSKAGSKSNSPLNAGYALTALADAARLVGKPSADARAALDKARAAFDALVDNAIEDEDMMVFEDKDGLDVRTTSLIAYGAAGVVAATGGAKPAQDGAAFSADRIVKMAEYFVASRYASNVAQARYVMQGLTAAAKNAVGVAAVVAVTPGVGMSKTAKGKLHFTVTDVLGAPLDAKVTLQRAVKDGSSDAVVTGKELTRTADGAFVFDFLALEPAAGMYAFTLDADVKDAAAVDVKDAELLVKISTDVKIGSAFLAVTASGDADEIVSKGGKVKAEYPAKIAQQIAVGEDEHLHVVFTVDDVVGGATVKPHQAFVRFVSAADNGATDVQYVAKALAQDNAFVLHAADSAADFDYASGEYDVQILVGDAAFLSSVQYSVARVSLVFKRESLVTEKSAAQTRAEQLLARPEIEHAFRQPESRPPAFASLVFTLAVLAPWFVLLTLLGLTGVNLANFPTTGIDGPISLAFLGCIAAFLLLLVGYWTHLNIFDVAQAAVVLAVPTVFLGHRTLQSVATARAQSKQ